jgi:nicotinic acid phosphoribosyltransferase
MTYMNPLTSPLLTDLYQLTMLEAYLREGMEETAVFEFYIRNLLSQGAPVDSFGVGTKLDTSEDAPYLECAGGVCR